MSTLILVFGLANDMLGFAILLVAGVSLGGFITMTLLALAAVEYVSSSLIVVAGGLLLVSVL